METVVNHFIWSACYLTVLLGLSAYGIHRWSIIYLFLKHIRKDVKPKGHFDELPTVTVQLPLFNEYYVVRRLLNAVAKIDYPREKLEVQVLDDSTDETRAIVADECARLAAKGLNIVHIHRTDRTGFKAGALENGMHTATGEFIFILDADFIPQPDVLMNSMDYFTDPEIGMVQMRWGHLNRNDSLLTRIQAMFLDGHLLLEQTARCRSGRFFNFNGTAGIWRRKAIEDGGGWQHDTLTEDLDLSYRSQLAGWKFEFLPDMVIPAELPPDMNGFKSQQHRWTKGSIQTCKKMLGTIWRSHIPFILKVEATMHLTSNFGYLLLALLCILMLPQTLAAHPASAGALRTWLVDVPIFFATTVSIATFYICAQRHLNPRGWIRDMLLLPMLLSLAIGMSVNNARAVLEAMLNHKSAFNRTPKYGETAKPTRTRRSSYLPLASLLPVIEILFAGYFAFCAWHAIMLRQWTSVPFILLFLVGFTYVSSKSIAFWLQRWGGIERSPSSTPSAA
jgi:cellulose synthase/poly-beta-1,6-N-acetylglucosamine synthase-like glycosyltransferase